MQPFEFLDYTPTPNERHLGIATIRAYGKIILKYKIISGKDGRGFFISPGSYKVGAGPDGKDLYEKCFMIDSNYENSQAEACIKANINPYAQNSQSNGPGAQNNQWGGMYVQPNQQNSVQGHVYPSTPFDTSHQTRGPVTHYAPSTAPTPFDAANQTRIPSKFTQDDIPF
jgi:hypothetical protein